MSETAYRSPNRTRGFWTNASMRLIRETMLEFLGTRSKLGFCLALSDVAAAPPSSCSRYRKSRYLVRRTVRWPGLTVHCGTREDRGPDRGEPISISGCIPQYKTRASESFPLRLIFSGTGRCCLGGCGYRPAKKPHAMATTHMTSNKALHLPPGYLSSFLQWQEGRQILVAS